MLKIIVFSSSSEVFAAKKTELQKLDLAGCPVVFCDSSKQCRGEFITDNPGQWLFFIDHDCQVDQVVLHKIRSVIESNGTPGNLVYSGTYRNPVHASLLQRVHNFIANTWLEQSYTSSEHYRLILGGVFLIHSGKKLDYSRAGDLFWGAEDKALSYVLNQQGYSINRLVDFQLTHNTSRSLQHFLKRAYLHGKNEVKYMESNRNKINYRFWTHKIGFANLNLLPLILLHFCIQRAAILFQKAPRRNKRQ